MKSVFLIYFIALVWNESSHLFSSLFFYSFHSSFPDVYANFICRLFFSSLFFLFLLFFSFELIFWLIFLFVQISKEWKFFFEMGIFPWKFDWVWFLYFHWWHYDNSLCRSVSRLDSLHFYVEFWKTIYKTHQKVSNKSD